MPERDWEADEPLMPDRTTIAISELVELRRLAAMLEWKPGPPTEPGFFAFTLSSQGLPYCEQFAANDFELGVRPWLKEVVWHIGPLPFPPEGSVFSK